MSQETSKGGLVGLPDDDFTQRQKSGLWSIEDLAAQKNFINNSNQPNILLSVGNYSKNSLLIYNIFSKTISNIDLNILSTVKNIDYNIITNLLVLTNPYLKIINTETLVQYDIPSIPSSIINTLTFNNSGDSLCIGLLDNLNTIQIIKLLNISDMYSDTSITLNYLPTKIKFNKTDEYLCIGHYGTLTDEFNNIHLYRYINNEYVDVTDYTLKNLRIGTVLDLCFVEYKSLLFISGHQEPYLSVYDFERQDLVESFNLEINKYITSRINSMVLTKDNNKLLIGCDLYPYFYILDLITNKISTPDIPITDSTILSISLSYNDQYMCILDRSTTPIKLFTYIDQVMSPITLDIQPDTQPLSACFFFGPQGVSE